MKKFFYISTLAAMTLAGCTDDSYKNAMTTTAAEDEPVAIQFGAGSDRAHTRTDLTGTAAASVLDYFFKIYGVKHVGSAVRKVFPNYVVEYTGTDGAGVAGSTDSNTSGWEYVGLYNYPNQTLHYWDFGADSYTFQAWSPTTSNVGVTVDDYNRLTLTTTSPDDLAKLYVADFVSIDKSANASSLNRYGNVVTFTFRSMAAKVRLGFYETISGYSVSQLTFRSRAGRFADTGANVLLDGSFNGFDNQGGGTYTLTYDAVSQRALLDFATLGTPADYYDFGSFTSGPIGTERYNPTWAGGTPDYQNVLPNEDNAGDMTLYIDFTLKADDGSDDIIKVTGAYVTVPATRMVWHPNFAYTYLFRITKDVNGTTGNEGTDPAKLYPITFDAIVAEEQTFETNPPIEVGGTNP